MNEQEIGESLGLDSDYVKKILEIKNNLKNGEKIKAVLVGRDPYDGEALGIPFSVKEWVDLPGSRKGNSGRYLLESLTDKSRNDLAEEHDNPTRCIEDCLLPQGIILLNSSYEFLKDCKFKKKARDNAYQFNKLFYAHCDNIFILGKKTQESQRARNRQGKFSFIEIPHPCCQAKSSKKDEWEHYWSKGALKKILKKSTNAS